MSTRLIVKTLLVTAVCLAFVLVLSQKASAQTDWQYCSEEGQRCNFDGTKDVMYGVPSQGQVTYAFGVTGGIDCNNNTFGDPAPGVHKQCFIKDSIGPTYLQPATGYWEKFQGAVYQYSSNCAPFGGTFDTICDVFDVHLGWNYIDANGNEQVGWTQDANGNVVKIPLRDYQIIHNAPSQRNGDTVLADPPNIWWIDYPSSP